MKYFDKDGAVYGYDDEQIKMGLADGLKEIELSELKSQKEFQPLSKRQFTLYMYDKGLLNSINDLLNADERVKLEFDNSFEIYRYNETVKKMSQAMNWTEDEVDAMWQEALAL